MSTTLTETAALQRRNGKTSRRARHGFTLIEAMLLIALLAVATALLLPSNGSRRLLNQNQQGQENLSTIYKSMMSYAQDNKQWAVTDLPAVATSYPQLDPGGVLYQQRAAGGWSIWDVNTAYPAHNLPKGRGPVGLGVLVAETRLKSPEVFFHPVMRDEDAGGGASRHWYNVRKNWGKYRGDETIASSGWTFGNNMWTVENGGVINSTVVYRGGDWTPNGDGVDYYNIDPPVAGAPGYDCFDQMNTKMPGYNKRVLMQYAPFEQQANRQGGQLDYTLGDGSVSVTRNAKFIGKPFSKVGNNKGIYAVETPDESLSHPSVGPKTIGLGQGAPYWAYLIERERGTLAGRRGASTAPARTRPATMQATTTPMPATAPQ